MALAGRQQGYALLLRRHREAVNRLAANLLGNADDALDVTQEAFVSAFASLARFDPQQPFRRWISRIAINKCRDLARRRRVRRFFTMARPLDEALEVADPADTPEQALAASRQVAQLRAAIARLPAKLAEVLVLRGIEELSQAEAAAVLGISPKAVETRLYRAKRALAEILEPPPPES